MLNLTTDRTGMLVRNIVRGRIEGALPRSIERQVKVRRSYFKS